MISLQVYLHSLRTLISQYIIPLRVRVAEDSSFGVKPQQLDRIFCNIESIAQFHAIMLGMSLTL